MQNVTLWVASVVLAIIFSLGVAVRAEVFNSKHYRLKVTTVVDGLVSPWGLAFLPKGRMIVTERVGGIRIVTPKGKLSPRLSGTPEVYDLNQGGMLDVAVDPEFSVNNFIYFSFAEPGLEGGGTAVARARLVVAGNRLEDMKVIFRQTPKSHGGRHFGSRLVFSRDGKLFITLGDRGQRDRAQDFTINRGNVIRIEPDGTVPNDNPFVSKPEYRSEVWSYGHRNPQGAALHPKTGRLWIHEHGAMGGDEINIPLARPQLRLAGHRLWPTLFG